MRRCAAALVGLLILAGCEISHIKPDQTVVISGRALSATGAPLSDVRVRLYKEADFGEFVFGATAALGSLGAVCLLPSAPTICSRGHEATTNADGMYRFTLKGSDVQGMVREVSTLDVVFADPKNVPAASTTLRFKARSTDVQLPTAGVWDAGLRVANGRSSFALSWRALKAAKGAAYTVQLLDPAQGVSMWTQAASGTSATIDARAIEDRVADAAVTARVSLGHDVNAAYLSAGTRMHPILGAPPSRNAPCSAISGTKQLVSSSQVACRVTDGDLAIPARLSASNGAVVTGVTVALPHARPIALIVVRGVADSVVVELSADGRTWRRVGTGLAGTFAVRVAGHAAARFVRVRSLTGIDENTIAEVSIW